MGALPRGKRVGVLFVVLLLLTCFFFIVSNLFLSSQWVRDKVAKKLEEKIGFTCHVESIKWSPWGGGKFRGVKIMQPEGVSQLLGRDLLILDSVKFRPYWGTLLKGDLRVRSVFIEGLQCYVSAEMLAELAERYSKPLVIETASEKSKTPSSVTKVKKSEKQASAKKRQPKPNPPKELKPKVVKPEVFEKEFVDFPMRFVVDRADFTVVLAKHHAELLNVDSVSLDLNLFGEDQESILRVSSVKVMDQLVLRGLDEKLEWKGPYLSFRNDKVDISGVTVRAFGKVELNRNNIKASRFQCGVELKPQALKSLDGLAMTLDADRVSGHMQLGGYCFYPMSYRGAVHLAAENLHILEGHGGRRIEFSEAYLPVMLRNGQLQWSGLRALSEEIAIMGNGGLSASGEVLAVTRLVVSPEVAFAVNKAMLGAMIPQVSRSWWSNLDTPDRKVRDIVLSGDIRNPMVDITRRHKLLPLWDVVKKVTQFIRREMKEEGIVLQPILNH